MELKDTKENKKIDKEKIEEQIRKLQIEGEKERIIKSQNDRNIENFEYYPGKKW